MMMCLAALLASGMYAAENCRWKDAVNLTWSPDSSKVAFTRANDLYVGDAVTGEEKRLTFDGTELILNGYASWVYYEEIFGRPSRYRAFWWSPDSRKIGFYRFDNTQVPLFPIYSPFGQDGSLNETRYPKAGERNPEVKIGMVDVSDAFTRNVGAISGAFRYDARNNGASADSGKLPIVWADFDPSLDQYFGIPFWGADSKEFFIARMPRLQNTLDLYAVNAADGSKRHIYNEKCNTWLYWIDEVIFTERGLYMARDFETGWEQIYFLSYDGKEFRRLTDGPNWRISLIRVDEKKGDVYFTAERDSRVASTFYKADRKGHITALTDPAYHVHSVSFSADAKTFTATYSNCVTPLRTSEFNLKTGKEKVLEDTAPEGFSPASRTLPQIVTMTTSDGFELPASIVYPENFDSSRKYPVHMDLYGGPDTPMVRDRWVDPARYDWWTKNDVIQITVDCRASGHNGRAGLDMIYRQLTVWEVKDFIEWAKWLKSLPYVDGERIGVEGFSFGGTMTTMLMMQAPEHFKCGIAGGGVYDWTLYDSHYTERYMDTPQNNPDGYKAACALNHVKGYPSAYTENIHPSGPEMTGTTLQKCDDATGQDKACGELQDKSEMKDTGINREVMLKLTHGTGDDNVHFQNTLQLIDAMQKEGRKFELMIYPDGMHGYRGYQGGHSKAADRDFWSRWLL